MQTVILLTITIIGWGIYHNFIKLATKTVPPPAIPIIFSICGLLTIPLYYMMLNKTHEHYKWSWDGIGWVIAAFLSTAIGTLAYMFAVSKNDISAVVGYATTYPILVCIIGVVFMGESFSIQKGIGLLLVLAGVFVSSR